MVKRSSGTLDTQEILRRYPQIRRLIEPNVDTKDSWEAAFTLKPEAMCNLLGDFVKQAYAVPGRVGQRPMPREEDVREIDALLNGEANELPITEVLPKIVNESERSFCRKIPMSRSQYQRLLKGEYQPTIYEMRAIADAVGRPPSFFVEYRKLMAIGAFTKLIDDRPGIATLLYRNYLTVAS